MSNGYEGGGFKEVNISQGHESSSPKPWNNPYPKKQYSNGFKPGGGFPKKPPVDFNLHPPILYKPYFAYSNANLSEPVLKRFCDIAKLLKKNGYTARVCSGDPDKLIYDEIEKNFKEIILPWKEFGGSDSKLTFTSEEVKFFAKKFFPYYETSKDAVKAFMAKDIRLVCGHTMKSIAQFGLIGTEDGCEHYKDKTRETGFASNILLVASELRVPVFNVGKPDVEKRLIEHLQLEPF